MSPVTVLPGNEIDLTTFEPKRLALSITEMEFALSLRPCIACNAFERDHVKISYFGPLASTAPAWQKLPKKYGVRCECPNCGAERRLLSWTVDTAEVYYDRYHLVGTGPCTIIEPHEFMAELDRLMPLISQTPDQVHHPAFDRQIAELRRAMTCANELRKFIVPGRTRLAFIEYTAYGIKHRTDHRSRYERDTNAALFPQLKALYDQYILEVPRIHAEKAAAAGPPKIRVGELNRDTIRAHVAWRKRGKSGDGQQLILHHQAFKDQNLPALAGAVLQNITFTKVSAYALPMTGSTMTSVNFTQSYINTSNWSNTILDDVTLLDSNANLVAFDGAKLNNCRFEDTEAVRTTWKDTVVERTVFIRCLLQDVRFDNVLMKHCDLNGNFLGATDYAHLATTAGARFEDCDFSRTGWHNRDLSGATFIRCKFAGSGGSPRAHDGLIMQDCDMTRDEFLAMLAAWEPTQAAKDRDAAALKK